MDETGARELHVPDPVGTRDIFGRTADDLRGPGIIFPPRDPTFAYTRSGTPVREVRGGAGGMFYHDTWLAQGPITADQGNITLTTTNKALWGVGLTMLPANFWTPGRMVRLMAWVKMSSGTAGNYTYSMAYGAGDNPACIVQSAARAYVASVGPFTLEMMGLATCRTVGTAGTLSMVGHGIADLALQLSTNQPNIFPSGGTSVVSTVDTTVGTNALTFQMIASAGTHTANTLALVMEALN